ncbi:hypothetical protein CU098_009420 [Rhizopus stolonifer]|uniref:Uncharacterized protein n=1 Tax=Rhizopus stolonifer TaxID=4846 RepID=A0A367JRC2_RHIST|nr:hypothetical protein CU098_009420 [Rhizopus stolonifer]
MSSLDPFIIYTVKLAMDFKLKESSAMASEPVPILTMDPIPLDLRYKPTLRKDNVLSLLYHAEEQWTQSCMELSDKQVHIQQAIFLDTLRLLVKAVMPDVTLKRFHEPIWFAAQVLVHHCHIRHLEHTSNALRPLAGQLYHTMYQLRLLLHQALEQQGILSQRYFWSTHFFQTKENTQLLDSFSPLLEAWIRQWSEFESALYEAYVHVVFGEYDLNHFKATRQPGLVSLSLDTCNALTTVLPIVLDRAIQVNTIRVGSIQSLDPEAFLAMPRLAVLAGVTWLAHLTGWRNPKTALPAWIGSHQQTLKQLVHDISELEKLLNRPSEEEHYAFVELYHTLEQSLVQGRHEEKEQNPLEKTIYLNVCQVADSIVSSAYAQSFTTVLYQLFRQIGMRYDIEFEEEEKEDAIPIEQIVLDLAIL